MRPIAAVILSGLLGVLTMSAVLGRDAPEPAHPKKPIGKAELYWLMNRACWHGDTLSVEMLLDAGADPNGLRDYAEFKQFEPSWPINQASWGGHLEVVELLLQAGAKVDLPEGEGFTALTIATLKNHPKVVQRLLHAGADRAHKTPEGTALQIAKAKGYADIVKLLEGVPNAK